MNYLFHSSNTAIDNLVQFFGGYFHQDFFHDAGTPEQVVRQFVSEGYSQDEIRMLAREIALYADSKKDDVSAEVDLFRELHCYYSPSMEGLGARSWLRHLSDLLASAASFRN